MVQSKAETVVQYLAGLTDDKRATIEVVRQVVLKRLPPGYVEVMNWGMISYEVPLSTFPETYNGKPLLYCALAAQKRHNAIYLMNLYADQVVKAELVRGFREAGKPLDMGKSCVRFKQLEDLPLQVIGKAVAATPMHRFIEIYHKSRAGSGSP